MRIRNPHIPLNLLFHLSVNGTSIPPTPQPKNSMATLSHHTPSLSKSHWPFRIPRTRPPLTVATVTTRPKSHLSNDHCHSILRGSCSHPLLLHLLSCCSSLWLARLQPHRPPRSFQASGTFLSQVLVLGLPSAKSILPRVSCVADWNLSLVTLLKLHPQSLPASTSGPSPSHILSTCYKFYLLSVYPH